MIINDYKYIYQTPITFYSEYLDWFDPEYFDERVMLSGHIQTLRRSGSTYSIVLNVLYDILFAEKTKIIYLNGGNFHITDAMYHLLIEIYYEVKSTCPFFNKLNKLVIERQHDLIFEHGSIKKLNSNFHNMSRGIGNCDIDIVVDEYDFLDSRIKDAIGITVPYLRYHNTVNTFYNN